MNAHLSEEINMKKLADESHFSLYHFQRIYRALMNESPYDSLLRLRLEKAVFMLKYEPKKKVTDIAFECGFPSPENFSRQFKTRYEMSPSAFKKDKKVQNSRIYQEYLENDFYLSFEKSREKPPREFEVKIEELPEIPIAFVRAIFGADGQGLVEKYLVLMDWAEKNNIAYEGALKRFGMSIDNPEVTPASKYRYDFALAPEKNVEAEGIIETGHIPASKYATVHCKGTIEDVAMAWDFLYKTWLPDSQYVPRHYPAIEEFIQGPEEIGWDKFNLKCRIPVKKLD